MSFPCTFTANCSSPKRVEISAQISPPSSRTVRRRFAELEVIVVPHESLDDGSIRRIASRVSLELPNNIVVPRRHLLNDDSASIPAAEFEEVVTERTCPDPGICVPSPQRRKQVVYVPLRGVTERARVA